MSAWLNFAQWAASAPAFRLMHVAASGNLTLDGLTLRGGGAIWPPSPRGGGLFNAGGTVTIRQSTFAWNTAPLPGGGGLYTAGGTVHIAQSLFIDNLAGVAAAGGGLLNDGGTVTITQSTFAHNGGQDSGGLHLGCRASA